MKRATAVVVGLFALAALCGAQDQEYWLKIERNGVGFGWEHTSIASLPSGQRDYRIEGLKKVDLIGLSPQEIAHQGAFRVDEDLRPLSFSYRVRFRDRETQVNGQCLDGRMRLSTVESNGGKREQELSMRASRVNSEDARNITYLNTADGLTLTVRATGNLPNPFRAKKVQIAVAWRNVSPEEFRFEDKRQRVLRTSATDGAHRVLLDLSRIDIRGNGIAAPVRGSGFSDYLGEDEYIKPADPAVRRQLADIRGEETDAYAIVGRILKWMQANIGTDLIVETLSAPEVFERRSGKCSEHAILFASLARAAGIPVKVVLGQAATSRSWVGHMWTEVWLGEWLPVDPSMASFVVGPSHLKLVDAPTVAGTQSLRTKLVDNLALEILGFEEDQSASSTELKTGIVGNTYTSAAYRSRISRPDETWSMTERASGSTISVALTPPEPAAARFELTMIAVPPGYPAKTILDGRITTLSGILGPLEILESSQVKIAGRNAVRVRYKVRDPEDGSAPAPLVSENCLFVDGANGYLFKLVFPEGERGRSAAGIRRDSLQLRACAVGDYWRAWIGFCQFVPRASRGCYTSTPPPPPLLCRTPPRVATDPVC